MKTCRGIRKDEIGWYAFWSTEGGFRDKYQTLRTEDRAKAEQWLTQGNCHGASAHDLTCPNCEETNQP